MLIELFSLCRDLRGLQDKRYSINNNTVKVIIPPSANLWAEKVNGVSYCSPRWIN